MPTPKIEFTIPEFVAYSYFAGTKTGKKFLFESGKIATSYAAQQIQLTGHTFVTQPAKVAFRSGARKAIQSGVIRASPPLAMLVVGGIAFNAIGNTSAVQKTGHIGNPGVLGMGGTL
jgi:hypothetical protein